MTGREWLAGLEWFGIKLGLETIADLTHALQHPERAYPVVHVAGTNGKGSVVAMIERALRASGRRTARYTSPHLVRLEERFAVDGEPVPPADLDRALTLVREAVGARAAQNQELPPPTYFEVTTAAAFEIFRAASVDVAVIEVGLGGRFDATNVVSPVLSVITSIDFDHETHLGNTLAAIASEKAGIIKACVPIVAGRLPAEALAIVTAVARSAGSPVHLAGEECAVEARAVGEGRREARFTTSHGVYGPVTLGLPGAHQIDNAAVAVTALECLAGTGLTVGPEAIVTGLADARWPGRLEMITLGDRRVLVDGAHNPSGARALAAYLREIKPEGLPIVFGVMSDKAIDQMLEALAPLSRPLVLTDAPGRRAAAAAELGARALRLLPPDRIMIEPDIDRALDHAWRHGRDIAAGGSLYLAGAVIARLQSRER